MQIQKYKEQYVLDVYTYDDSFYTVPFEHFELLKQSLNKEKFVQINGDLLATSSVKKVIKRQLKTEHKESDKYREMSKKPKTIPKEMILKAKQNALKYIEVL